MGFDSHSFELSESSQLGCSLLGSKDSGTLNSELFSSQFSGTDASKVGCSSLVSSQLSSSDTLLVSDSTIVGSLVGFSSVDHLAPVV